MSTGQPSYRELYRKRFSDAPDTLSFITHNNVEQQHKQYTQQKGTHVRCYLAIMSINKKCTEFNGRDTLSREATLSKLILPLFDRGLL